MKQVLLMVHNTAGRSSNLVGLVKYLPEFNWQPVILAGAISQYTNLPARVVETPDQDALGFLRDLGRQMRDRFDMTPLKYPVGFLLSLAGEIINYPCPDKNWKRCGLEAAREILQKEEIDAIISSSPALVNHLVSSELKGKYPILWIAHLRDLWSQNFNYGYSPLRRALDRRLELKTLSKADALVTVSQPLAEQLGALHKGKPVYTITHGFDPVLVNSPPAKLTAKFTITYTGTVYAGIQKPEKLFAALSELLSNGTMNPDEIEVRFYGRELGWLDREIEQYGLSNIAKQYGIIPPQVAQEKQRESQVLFKLNREGPEGKGAYSAKIFDYLGARRPILAIGGVVDHVVAALLKETKAGLHTPTTEDIKVALKEFYQEYKLKGEVTYRGEESEISKYSHREMARKFAEILDHLA